MAKKIVLTIEEGLTAQEIEDLKFLLQDAMQGFAAARAVPGRYVADRYPSLLPTEYVTKTLQVTRRVELARKVMLAAFDLKLEDVS